MNKKLNWTIGIVLAVIVALQLANISHELHNVSRNLLELKTIQQI